MLENSHTPIYPNYTIKIKLKSLQSNVMEIKPFREKEKILAA